MLEFITELIHDPLFVARLQFALVTIYHFWMVPLTLGLGPLLIYFQHRWHKTGDEKWYRLTRFWGKLFLINFTMGVATGIVQEFQFGIAWSEYSRMVGDVFGVPLALEALLAFFMESIFLGLWIFGWNRLPRKLHLFALIMAVIGSILSAFFILVANSWMQHPVGVELVDGRPVLNDVWALLMNSTALAAFIHTITASFVVSGMFLLGISWYKLWQRRHTGVDKVVGQKVDVGASAVHPKIDYNVWLYSLRIGAVIAIIGFAGSLASGDILGKLMFQQQPMKMAAAEAMCSDGADFSVLSVGKLSSNNCEDVNTIFSVPGLLGFLANYDFSKAVRGIKNLEPEYKANYGSKLADNPLYGDRAGQEIDYVPLLVVTYWSFRLMIILGAISAGAGVLALWLTRRGIIPAGKWWKRLAICSILFPFISASLGWIFTEVGRQPFVVAPNPTGVDGVFMFTAAAVSPKATAGLLWFSLLSLLLIYSLLLVVEVVLLARTVRGGVNDAIPENDTTLQGDKNKDDVLDFVY